MGYITYINNGEQHDIKQFPSLTNSKHGYGANFDRTYAVR